MNYSFVREAVGLGLNRARFRALWPQTSKAFEHVTTSTRWDSSRA